MTIASTQASMVTRCPKCGTAFRITAAQLESAKGAVRCGSCLHVFKAQSSLVTKPAADSPAKKEPVKSVETKKESFKDSLKPILPKPEIQKPVTADNPKTNKTEASTTTKSMDTKPAQTKPQAKPATNAAITRPTTKATASGTQNKRTEPVISSPKVAPKPDAKSNTMKKPLAKISDDDDMLISDDMEDGSRYDFDGYMDLETQVQVNSLFDRKVIDEKKIIKDNSDESWAENLIDDDDDDVPQIGIVKTQVAKVPPVSPVQEAKNNLVFNFVDDAKTKSTEPSPAKDLELSDELSRIPTAKPLGESHLEEKEEIINAIPVAGIFHDDEFDDAMNKRQLKIEPKIRSYDGSRASLLKNIMPAPLEFAANNIRHWYFRMLWPVMTLLALLVLILQLAYFRFDHYSRIQPYRNIYAIACPIVGCQLPTLVDKKLILTYNLSVAPHNEIEQALRVDVMMLNKAEFEQPFPDLLLSFSDMDGAVKASRRFTPNDYLGGELAGKKTMPSKQPIHIILEINDPQVDNYKIDVL